MRFHFEIGARRKFRPEKNSTLKSLRGEEREAKNLRATRTPQEWPRYTFCPPIKPRARTHTHTHMPLLPTVISAQIFRTLVGQIMINVALSVLFPNIQWAPWTAAQHLLCTSGAIGDSSTVDVVLTYMFVSEAGC